MLKTSFLFIIYLTDKFCISLFTDAKYHTDESVTLPVFLVFLLQAKSCYGSGASSKHTAYISAADLGNSTAPVVYHVQSRSGIDQFVPF